MTVYSYSRIESFKQCPKKYELAYIRRAPRSSRGIEAYMGSCVHEALEKLYADVCMGRIPDITEVLERFRELWQEGWDPCIRIVRTEYTAEDYRMAGERMLRTFYERHHPFDRGTTTGIEQRVLIDLDDSGENRLQGYVDRIVKVADGTWEIHDYKTSRSLPTQQDADNDRQLALYEMALREMHPEIRDVTLVWHYLLHDHELRSTRTPEQLEGLRSGVLSDIGDIEAAGEYPTRISRLCDWCDYRASCPAWSHEATLEEGGTDAFTEDADAALVERYAEVMSKISDLRSEKASLREELLARMEEQQVIAVAGGSHRVRVSESSSARLPKSDHPERAELEEILKAEGLWDRFSTVDAKSLAEGLSGDEIDPEARQKIECYVTMSVTKTLRCSER